MNIWYLHHYATPYELPGLHRPFEFGEYFAEKGHKITVFSSSYLHYNGDNMIKDRQKYIIRNYGAVPTVFVKTSPYTSGFGRVANMVQFYRRMLRVAKKYGKENGYPDVIIASSPHPLTMLAGLKIAKKLKIPCICEVRDFWPEVFFYGGRLKEKSPAGKALLAGERYIYEKADALTFLKEGDHTYITDKGWDMEHGGRVDMSKCIYINNGVDIALFDKRKKEFVYEDADLDSQGFKIVYCGTIRPVNDVDLILDTAKLLGGDCKFLVYGTGNCVPALQKRIDDEHIDNVKLKGYVDNNYIPSILSRSSLNLLNYSGSAYNWSRGNSSNKLFEYLASGKPVLSTVKMGYDIIERHKCGISAEETTPQSIARGIEEMKRTSKEDYTKMCVNARAAAEEYDIPRLADEYSACIEAVIKKYDATHGR